MDAAAVHEAKIRDGWVLYYSEEGYPYYYNDSTGESEWAPYGEETANHAYYDDSGAVEADVTQNEDDDASQSEEDSEVENESSDDDATESTDDSGQKRMDKVLEAQFLAYLRTPEGMAAAEAELERVGKKFEKRAMKRSSEAELEYVRELSTKKKDLATRPATIVNSVAEVTSNLLESANSWMFPKRVSSTPSRKKKESKESGERPSRSTQQGTSSKYDDYNRETKQRHVSSAAGVGNSAGSDGDALERGSLHRTGSQSPGSSRSSSISSDTGSVSSDDSDVEQIDAPLFSELPAWLSISTLSARLFGTPQPSSANPDRTVDGAENDGSTDAGSAASSSPAVSTALIPYNPANLINLAYLQSATAEIAQQSFVYLGGAFVQGFGLLFERLNPLLEDFVSGMIDTQLGAGGAPTQRNNSSARSSAATAVSSRSSGRIRGDEVESGVGDASSRSAGQSSARASGHTSSRQSAQRPPSARAAAAPTPRTIGTQSARPGAPPLPPTSARSARSTPRTAQQDPRYVGAPAASVAQQMYQQLQQQQQQQQAQYHQAQRSVVVEETATEVAQQKVVQYDELPPPPPEPSELTAGPKQEVHENSAFSDTAQIETGGNIDVTLAALALGQTEMPSPSPSLAPSGEAQGEVEVEVVVEVAASDPAAVAAADVPPDAPVAMAIEDQEIHPIEPGGEANVSNGDHVAETDKEESLAVNL